MLFSQYHFILFFLPICLVIYVLARRYSGARLATATLFLASLVFYGWSNPLHVPLLIISILANFYLARSMSAYSGSKRRMLFIFGVVANLAALAFFKYANFAITSVNALGHWSFAPLDIALPLAISFFTFQQIAYLSDCYRGYIREYSLINYGLFVSFFPHLIAGPVVHHSEMMAQYEDFARKPLNLDTCALGLLMFTLGLVKKVYLADNLAYYGDPLFSTLHTTPANEIDMYLAWLASLTFSFQIYFDFSGYTDMAIGLALLFGIHFPMNFNSPYQATSIIDFWKRWHMTLSRWLRDYLYIPLGGNRCGRFRRYANLGITMLLGGLWHGAQWTFVVWGMLHGLYLMINHAWRHAVTRHLPASVTRNFAYRLYAWLFTSLAVVTAWVFFRADSLDSALALVRAMYTHHFAVVPPNIYGWLGSLLPADLMQHIKLTPDSNRVFGGMQHLGMLGVCFMICVFFPNSQRLLGRFKPTLEQTRNADILPPTVLSRFFTPSVMSGFICGAIIIAVITEQLLSQTKIPAFIYFNF